MTTATRCPRCLGAEGAALCLMCEGTGEAPILDLAEEIGDLARVGLALGQRRDVPVAERLAYHRRKAVALSLIAAQRDDAMAAACTDAAWRYVQTLVDEMQE